MTLDPKALEAAAKMFASQNIREMASPSDVEGAAEDLRDVIQAYLDAADLVERSEFDSTVAALLGEHTEALQGLQKAADFNLKANLDIANKANRRYRAAPDKQERDEALYLAETQGRQPAALREAVYRTIDSFLAAPFSHETISWKEGESRNKLVRQIKDKVSAALTDTAAAAAQWVRVDDEHVVVPVEPTNRILHYLYGPFLSSGSHQSRIDAYKSAMQLAPVTPNLSSVALAEGEAGEGEGE